MAPGNAAPPKPATPYDEIQLTEHFRLREYSVSREHPELVEPVPPIYRPNAQRHAETILEPLRVRVDRVLHVNSGYRSEALNDAIGGSATSQHLRCEAADVTTPTGEGVREIFRRMLADEPRLPTGQVIYYPDRNFIHIALPGRVYRSPSFHIHCPRLRLKYHRITSVADLNRLVPLREDPR